MLCYFIFVVFLECIFIFFLFPSAVLFHEAPDLKKNLIKVQYTVILHCIESKHYYSTGFWGSFTPNVTVRFCLAPFLRFKKKYLEEMGS